MSWSRPELIHLTRPLARARPAATAAKPTISFRCVVSGSTLAGRPRGKGPSVCIVWAVGPGQCGPPRIIRWPKAQPVALRSGDPIAAGETLARCDGPLATSSPPCRVPGLDSAGASQMKRRYLVMAIAIAVAQALCSLNCKSPFARRPAFGCQESRSSAGRLKRADEVGA